MFGLCEYDSTLSTRKDDEKVVGESIKAGKSGRIAPACAADRPWLTSAATKLALYLNFALFTLNSTTFWNSSAWYGEVTGVDLRYESGA